MFVGLPGRCRVGSPGCRGVAGSVPGCRVPGAAGCCGCCQAVRTCAHFRVLPGAAGLPGCRVTAGSLPRHCRVICCRGRGRGATRRPRSARANLPSLLTLLLALDCRHTPPLLAGCGWLRSWDACPHRRSCALRVGSLCASCARLFAGSAAWRRGLESLPSNRAICGQHVVAWVVRWSRKSFPAAGFPESGEV